MKLFYILLVCFASVTGQLSTGVKVRVTTEGLNYGASIAVDLLEEQISNARIPDQSSNGFDLKDIRITRFEKPSPVVTLNPGSGLSATLNNAAITVEANWKYSVGRGWFKIRDSGRLTLKSNRFTIGSALDIGKDETGRPVASSRSCSCSIRGFDVKFHGGMSVIYNLFARLFENQIRNKLQDLTCEKLVNVVNTKVKEELASLNVNAKIENDIQLDYRLSENPVFTGEYLETSHVGEFLSGNVRYPVLPNHSSFNIKAPQKMATISISDRVFNSGAFILQSIGKFNFSESFRTRQVNEFLNISNENLSFELHASSTPQVRVTSSYLQCSLAASLRLLSNPTHQPPTQLLAFELGLKVLIDINIVNGRITGNFISIEPNVISSSSSLVNLPASDIQQALDYILGMILPSLNNEAAKGFPLPQLDFISFRDTVLSKEEGVMTVATNIIAHN